MEKNPLEKYQEKRDFSKTPEPSKNKESQGKNSFVIQKHDASTLHYDFRLEINNILKSWAIPKGPSLNPKDKRLAIPTEDHPLNYIDFEGVIPEDRYGGGKVIVWDKGTYENTTKDENDKCIPIDKALKNGHITFWLNGKKLKGEYALIRTNIDKNKKWILVKMKDEKADRKSNVLVDKPSSVLSGRKIEELS